MKSIRPYLNVFYLLGLSPHLADKPDSKYKKCRTSTFFVVIQAAIGIALATSCIQVANFGGYEHLWSRTDIVIINFVAICEIVRIAFILIQCLFCKDILNEICYTFRMLQAYYAMHLHHQIAYQQFSKQYFRKVIFIVCGFIPYLLIFIWESCMYTMLPIGVQIKALQIMTSATYLHIIFYIDILSFFLAELNVVIERDAVNGQTNNNIMIISEKSLSSISIREKLRCYKTVHFHLWEVAQRINAFFGWSMVAVLLHGFVDFVCSSYWLVQQLQPPWAIAKIIRELENVPCGIAPTEIDEFRIRVALVYSASISIELSMRKFDISILIRVHELGIH